MDSCVPPTATTTASAQVTLCPRAGKPGVPQGSPAPSHPSAPSDLAPGSRVHHSPAVPSKQAGAWETPRAGHQVGRALGGLCSQGYGDEDSPLPEGSLGALSFQEPPYHTVSTTEMSSRPVQGAGWATPLPWGWGQNLFPAAGAPERAWPSLPASSHLLSVQLAGDLWRSPACRPATPIPIDPSPPSLPLLPVVRIPPFTRARTRH